MCIRCCAIQIWWNWWVSEIGIQCSEMNILSGGAESDSKLSTRSEEFLQKLCALSGEHTAAHFNLVIERGVIQNMHC